MSAECHFYIINRDNPEESRALWIANNGSGWLRLDEPPVVGDLIYLHGETTDPADASGETSIRASGVWRVLARCWFLCALCLEAKPADQAWTDAEGQKWDECLPCAAVTRASLEKELARLRADLAHLTARLAEVEAEPVGDVREEHRITGDPGPGYPPYEYRATTPEEMERFKRLLAEPSAFRRNVADIVVERRTVTTTPWIAVPPTPEDGEGGRAHER